MLCTTISKAKNQKVYFPSLSLLKYTCGHICITYSHTIFRFASLETLAVCSSSHNENITQTNAPSCDPKTSQNLSLKQSSKCTAQYRLPLGNISNTCLK